MNVWLAEEEQFYIVTPGSGQFGGILSFVLIGPPQLFPFRPRPEVVETVCTYTYTYRSKVLRTGTVTPPP